MSIIKCENLTKKFGKKVVLDNVNINIKHKGVYGLIGNNGCGKTTTMKLMLGLLKKSSGNIYIYDQKVKFGNTKTNRYIGYLPDVPTFYNFMTGPQYLKFCAQMLKIEKNEYKRKIETLLILVGLDKNEKTQISAYSRGMKQRLGIAQALIGNPKILICDEPTSALDPQGRKDILNILKKLGEQIVVIFSTHVLSDVESTCNYVSIIKNKKISEFDEIQKLKQKYFTNKFVISFNTENELIEFKNLANWKNTQISQELNLIVHDDNINTKYQQAFKYIFENQFDVCGIYKVEPSLEDIFLEETNDV